MMFNPTWWVVGLVVHVWTGFIIIRPVGFTDHHLTTINFCFSLVKASFFFAILILSYSRTDISARALSVLIQERVTGALVRAHFTNIWETNYVLDDNLTLEALTMAVGQPASGRAPMIDGLSAEFLKHFWELIGRGLH